MDTSKFQKDDFQFGIHMTGVLQQPGANEIDNERRKIQENIFVLKLIYQKLAQ